MLPKLSDKTAVQLWSTSHNHKLHTTEACAKDTLLPAAGGPPTGTWQPTELQLADAAEHMCLACLPHLDVAATTKFDVRTAALAADLIRQATNTVNVFCDNITTHNGHLSDAAHELHKALARIGTLTDPEFGDETPYTRQMCRHLSHTAHDLTQQVATHKNHLQLPHPNQPLVTAAQLHIDIADTHVFGTTTATHDIDGLLADFDLLTRQLAINDDDVALLHDHLAGWWSERLADHPPNSRHLTAGLATQISDYDQVNIEEHVAAQVAATLTGRWTQHIHQATADAARHPDRLMAVRNPAATRMLQLLGHLPTRHLLARNLLVVVDHPTARLLTQHGAVDCGAAPPELTDHPQQTDVLWAATTTFQFPGIQQRTNPTSVRRHTTACLTAHS